MKYVMKQNTQCVHRTIGKDTATSLKVNQHYSKIKQFLINASFRQGIPAGGILNVPLKTE